MPLNDAYKPDAKRWVCTCPSFSINRFLLCKHLVQSVQAVPPVFFLEVTRQRTTPFWKHAALKLLDSNTSESTTNGNDEGIQRVEEGDENEPEEGSEGVGDDDDDDDDDEWAEMPLEVERQTFEESFNQKIVTMGEFLEGLKYQVQFRDHRMLKALEREGRSFLRLAEACLTKEKSRGPAPTTWGKSTSMAMFYRPRPSDVDP